MLLGLGVANKAIAGWHGGVFDRPLKRAREYIEVVRKVAAGERVEYEGEIYNTGKRFQLSWKPSHPNLPVYLAGLGPQMTKLVGKISDGVFINMATPEKVKEIAARVREGAIEAGPRPEQDRDHRQVARVAQSRTRMLARAKLRQVLTFYNIADHYSDMLRGMGFEKEVNAIHEAFQKGGFKAAMGALTDEYMDKLPVVPASDVREIKEKMKAFEEAGVDPHGDSLRAGDRAGGRRCAAVSSKRGEARSAKRAFKVQSFKVQRQTNDGLNRVRTLNFEPGTLNQNFDRRKNFYV